MNTFHNVEAKCSALESVIDSSELPDRSNLNQVTVVKLFIKLPQFYCPRPNVRHNFQANVNNRRGFIQESTLPVALK